MVYDGADRQIQVTDALNNVANNQFDASGNLVFSKRTEVCTITAPDVANETFSSAMFYDSPKPTRPPRLQGADGNFNLNVIGLAAAFSFWEVSRWNLSTSTLISCTAYDSRGNQVLSVDPKGNSSVTVFDGASRHPDPAALAR